MLKTEAIHLFGGSKKDLAAALEITTQAVGQWPEELPRRISDRVIGAWTRQNMVALPNVPGLAPKLTTA
uniref:Cro/CI family transcriptional regulator n=1 Tax=Variovorax boronicumulans TaxID=436515 RepID=UPI00358FE8B0